MAKITVEDLEHLTTEELRSTYIIEDWRKLQLSEKVMDYLKEGAEIYDLSNRLNRLESLTNKIVIKRFAENKL